MTRAWSREVAEMGSAPSLTSYVTSDKTLDSVSPKFPNLTWQQALAPTTLSGNWKE